MENQAVLTEQKVTIGAKIPIELEEKIKKIAETERRTFSNTVFLLLDTHPRLVAVEGETALAK